MSTRSRSIASSMALGGLALCLFSCVSAAERLQRFEGRPVSELIAVRGPAGRIVQYPYGGRLYIWEEERTTAASADATGKLASAGQRLAIQVYREMALVGDNGVIVRTHTENGTKGTNPTFY